MHCSRPLVLVLVILSALSLTASDTYEEELSRALVKHIIVLRNFYTDKQLKFDSDGKLVSKATPGFGPTDGRVYVRQVHLSPSKLVLTGSRPMDEFKQQDEKWELEDTGKSVAIEIQLPTGEPANTSVSPLLNAVFFKQPELAKMKCSVEEERELIEDQRKRSDHTVSRDAAAKLPDVTNLDELHSFCLPGGDRAYKVGRGITVPHVKHAPDPAYDLAARKAGLQGTAVLLAIITPEGATSAISIQRSLTLGIDEKLRPLGLALDQRAVEAVSQWRFAPAKFQGKPVPVLIDVEVNFKLY